ncbi:hypothetical protein ACIQM0_17390 [Streptomyces sp. NPDC091387]|uniref:hypothetical protein n=1 Tax=Streptomyces sp. NPDC091387 TaxID=3365998 RepID=UPI003821FE23
MGPAERAGEPSFRADPVEGWRESRSRTWLWSVIVVFVLRQPAGAGPTGEELKEFTRQKVTEATKPGIDPLSDRAAPVVDGLAHRFAEVSGTAPDP